MKVIFSIILLIVLFISVYRINKLEQFQAFSTSDIRDISRLECCGEGMQGPPGVTGPIGKSAYNIAYDLESAKGIDKAYWTSLPEDERKSEWITSLTGKVGDKGERGFTGQVLGVTGPVGDSAYNVAYAAEQEKNSDDRAYWFDETDKEDGEEAWLTSITGRVGEVGDSVPIGSIIAFHGETPPERWKICNGVGTYIPEGNTNAVPIPDLRGRFVVGYHDSNADYDVDDTGGSESVTLTVNQIPAHTHTHTKATHPSGSGPEQNQSGGPEDRTNFGDTGTTSSTGGGQSHENRPPYYALCYIMKT